MPPQPGLGAHLDNPYGVRGLHDPRLHHESCGVAFVATLAREPTHQIVSSGLEALCNLGHRGATGADPLSGDGAGILSSSPTPSSAARRRFPCPRPGAYAVGMVFLPRDDAGRRRLRGDGRHRLPRRGAPAARLARRPARPELRRTDRARRDAE